MKSHFITLVDLAFPPEWVKAALVLALFATAVVIGLFIYLNRFTKKSYFSLWTVAWLFYAGYLVAAIRLAETAHDPSLLMAQLFCIGCCALFMFWGSFQLTDRARDQRELAGGVGFFALWSYVAAYEVQDILWITYPVFVLLALASAHAGLLYRRFRGRYRSANVLAAGFILWAMHLMIYPCHAYLSPGFVAVSYLGNAVLALFIAMGMIAQMLEEARERNDTLVAEYLKGVARRRLLEQAVSASEQKYSALFESASDAIILVDLESSQILEANQSAQRLTLRAASELAGRDFADLCPEVRSGTTALLDRKKIFDSVFRPSREFLIVRSNGSQVECEGSMNLLECDNRPIVQLNIREVGERKRLEHQLQRAEKLSAIGQLVAGVAHELNNPLAVIMGFAQIMAKQRSLDERTKGNLVKIVHESERASKIVRNLLTFARPRDPEVSAVDINAAVVNVLGAQERQVRNHGIHVIRNLAGDLPRTMADAMELEQVITNLVSNAVQAMSNHDGVRRLEVRTELIESAIRLIVADSGPGILKHLQNRIFDPFFTTKAPGKGTGLGLSISHTIITQHRGRLWFECLPNRGTRFIVDLPVVAPISDVVDLPVATTGKCPTNPKHHRILIADDEPGIVEVLREVLKGVGYDVDTATNGEEALSKLSSNQYDVVISDLCMPEISGQKLYELVRGIQPDLARRIIFVTGDTVSADSRQFLESTSNRWFSKPFDIEEIEQIVNETVSEELKVTAVS